MTIRTARCDICGRVRPSDEIGEPRLMTCFDGKTNRHTSVIRCCKDNIECISLAHNTPNGRITRGYTRQGKIQKYF